MLQDVICETDDPGGVGPVVGEIPRTKNRLLAAPVQEELPSCGFDNERVHITQSNKDHIQNTS
ncbi:hypothetical protein DPMN_185154 [Dreissena polymorpha]|uniref:Uncharacterized protein n=1 Tax=Dreissena polymorpha TaxID=45954 RepID=A0A9D4I599_DREPO|nr:hypothetical protein DPMN_185154 [Dreissena polymorpha]